MLFSCAVAEWQPGIKGLMEGSEAVDFAEKQYTIDASDDASSHTIACQVTVNATVYGFEFEFLQDGTSISDWSPVQSWLGDIVTTAASAAGNDASALVEQIDKHITESKRDAAFETTTPVWADEGLKLKRVTVSSPYYPQLSSGSNGSSVQQLQERLIVLGFLNDTPDGNYGGNTRVAVKAAKEYVRMLEEEAITRYEAEATPKPTATIAATDTPTPTPTPTATPMTTHELTLVPRETVGLKVSVTPTPVPTEEPMAVAEDEDKIQPQTVANGVADALLQAYLFSWSFPTAHKEVANGASGKDVLRVQTRLNNLGYLAETADGMFGNSTYSAIKTFQRYNGIEETGIADFDTQKVLFSANAKEPEYRALTEGSTGDAVKKLQEALVINGFVSAKADGNFGSATQTGVERYQRYLNSVDGTENPVTGIADSTMLERLYTQGAPLVGGTIKKGDSGDEVARFQRRLIALDYLEGSADGNFGTGTETAIKHFQKQHHLTQTGAMDAATAAVLYSADATVALMPYVVEVSIADQRVYVYGLDDNNEYNVLEKTMICSTGKSGSETPLGTFQSTTGPGARWHYFTKFDCWAQYAYYIQGDIMFHSVLYKEKEGSVTQSSVNNLGRQASHGCVRLAVEDAKWIYENCPKNTKVVIYAESNSKVE